jgi:hypothetical protein
MPNATTRNAYVRIADLEPFTTGGALAGFDGYPSTHGNLPREWSALLTSMRADVVYVVMSYRTPIAWVTSGGDAYVPAVKYSPTTSRHQGQCRRGLHAYVDALPQEVK